MNNKIELVNRKTDNYQKADNWFIKIIINYQEFMIKHKLIKWLVKILIILVEIFALSLIVLTISFFLINAAPGKPGISSNLPEDEAKIIEAKYHLNDPAITRWALYIKNIFKGDFGISLSIFPGLEINKFVWKRFWTSSSVGFISLIFTMIIGIPLGILSGRKISGFSAIFSTIFIAFMISFPSMIFGLLLLLLGKSMGIPYIYSNTSIATWIIPALALSLSSAIAYVKFIRTTMNTEISSPHARFAKLKGASNRRVIWKHALKPSLFPVATIFPMSIIAVFTGALFIEKIFMIPGAGFLMVSAAQTKDTYVLLLLVTLYTMLTILAFRLRDWLYVILDPRLRKRAS